MDNNLKELLKRSNRALILSIIIPVYNVEEYLHQCLDSVANQTLLKDFYEVIIVDDKSTDGSLDIAEEYAKRYANFRVISLPENTPGGAGIPSNIGIKEAKGDYIGFVDSDDFVLPSMFEDLLLAALANPDTDLVICSYKNLNTVNGKIITALDSVVFQDIFTSKFKLLSDVEKRKHYLKLSSAPWRKLYRKSFLDKYNICYPEGDFFFEDLPLHWFCITQASVIAVIDKSLVVHRMNREGQTAQSQQRQLLGVLPNIKIIKTFLLKKDFYATYRFIFYEDIARICHWAVPKLDKALRKELLGEIANACSDFSINDINLYRSGCKLKLATAIKHYFILHSFYDLSFFAERWTAFFVAGYKEYKKKTFLKFLFTKFKENFSLNRNSALAAKNRQLEGFVNAITQQVYNFSWYLWFNFGATDELMCYYAKISATKSIWEKICPDFWLIYISVLFERGQDAEAEGVLNSYMNIYGLSGVAKYFLVSKLVDRLGLADAKVNSVAEIFGQLESGREQNLFEKMILGKSVAVVGNGPSEIGKGKGKEIDAHEIVIRFNNYHLSGYEEDYGTKTDIWICCSSDDIQSRSPLSDFQLVVYEPDYMHHILTEHMFDLLFQGVKNSKTPITYFGLDIHKEVREATGVFPSTGLLTVYTVKKLNKTFTFNDCYGFSFLENTENTHFNHYFFDREEQEDLLRTRHHDVQRENEFLKKLFDDNQVSS